MIVDYIDNEKAERAAKSGKGEVCLGAEVGPSSRKGQEITRSYSGELLKRAEFPSR